MNKKLAWLAALLLAVSFALAIAACTGKDPDPWTVKKLLYEGRKELEKGHGSVAYNYFKEALDLQPENEEAHYGITLSLDKRVFANVDGIIDLLTGVYVYNPTKEECVRACDRLKECNLLEEAWTTEEDCVQDCPFALQPYMFHTMIDGSTCYKIRQVGLEWILPTTPPNCEALCNDLEYCGLIVPPVTFTVEECIAHCPYGYVEHHSKCYLQHLGECNGYDRTCFDHTTVGLQILFREIGIFVPEEIIRYSQWVLDNSEDFLYQYFLRKYNWTLVDPPLTLDLSGRYDHGFMHFSRILGYGFHALLLFCTSVQLEMNFQVFDINFNYGAPDTTRGWVQAIARALEILLYDPIFPNGLVVLPDDFAIEQVQDGGQELGNMFGSLASWIEYMFADRDKQEGKAISYTDENENYRWDDGEVLTVRGVEIADTQVELTREQMQAIHDLAIVLRDNFLERQPFPIEAFRPVLDAFGLEMIDWVVDLFIAWSEDGTADWSEPFYNPQRFSFRDLLAILIEKLHIVDEVMGELGVE